MLDQRRRSPGAVRPRGDAWCGGGGNRTRVRQRRTRTSPGAVRCGFSQPRRSRGRVAEPGSVTVHVASSPVTGLSASGPLVDASDRAEGLPGLTDLHTRSGGEGKVGARCIGTYWFATMVDEITSPPRPASPGTTSDVETCHPHRVAGCPPWPRVRTPRPPSTLADRCRIRLTRTGANGQCAQRRARPPCSTAGSGALRLGRTPGPRRYPCSSR